jgi:DNA-binding NarL/FixJ family response regulator
MIKYKIFIYDDDDFILSDLKSELSACADMKCVGTAKNARFIKDDMERYQPDLVVMDIGMPPGEEGGIHGLSWIKANYPSTKVLMLTNFEDSKKIAACFEARMNGYLLKSEPIETILTSMKDILEDKIEPWRFIQMSCGITGKQKQNKLSLTENKVLKCAYKTGLNGQELADQLVMNLNTMNSHLQHIFKKLSVNSLVQTIKLARENRWFD